MAPVSGGDPALSLRFTLNGTASPAATNDLGSPFALNQIVLDSDSTGTFTVAGNLLKLTGATPGIQATGFGDTLISASIELASSNGSTTIGGRGFGNLQLANISESGPAQRLIVKSSAPTLGSQFIVLSGANNFTGGLTLESGNLLLVSSPQPGSPPITVNGGTVRLSSSGGISANFSLNTDLVMLNSTVGTLFGSIASATPGTGLTVRGAGVQLTAVSTYSGATTLGFSPIASAATFAAGTIVVDSNASLANSSEFIIGGGGELRIHSQIEGPTNAIADNAPVKLRGGKFIFLDNGGAAQKTETIGALDSSGYSTVTVLHGFGTSVRLNASALSRTERGTFLFAGDNLGAASGSDVGSLLLGTAPLLSGGGGVGAATSILPYAIGSTVNLGTSPSFVTYSAATGIRPLNTATDFSATLIGASTNNVRLSAATTTNSAATVNALMLDAGSINGSGTVTITSGALMQRTFGPGIENPINFGAMEGNVFAIADLVLSGPINGSGGLTKSGLGKLTLGAASNPFTGTLTVNAGLVSFPTIAALGASTSEIVINGQGAGLSYSGTAAATFSRDLRVGNMARIESSGPLLLNGVVSGSGGVQFTGTTGVRITVGAANTYTGPTSLNGGDVVIGSDTAFGMGGGVDFASGGSLVLSGNWISARHVSVSATAAVNTAAFNATLNGPFTGTGTITKAGLGTLMLTSASPFTGTVNVAAGNFTLAGTGSLRTPAYSLQGAGLVLDNSAFAEPNRLDDNAGISLNSGTLTVMGNSGTALTERVGNLTVLAGRNGNSITLTHSGAPMILAAAGLAPTSDILIRGDQLGGGPAGGFTRVIFTTPPTQLFGLVRGVYADGIASGSGSSFAMYDTSMDAAGTVGLRPLRAAEYSSGAVIQNPSNGGSTPITANFLANGATSSSGDNAIGTLTLESASSVTLAAGQKITLGAGGILTRAGGTAPTISGGILDGGWNGPTIFTGGSFQLSSVLRGQGGFTKTGSGTLTFSGIAEYGGPTTVAEGTLRPGAGSPLQNRTILISNGATFDLGGLDSTVGGLNGPGNVILGSRALTLGGLSYDMTFFGAISGTGGLLISDIGAGLGLRMLTGTNTFSGGISLNSGRLAINNSALGSGTLTVNGGQLRTAGSNLALIVPVVLNGDLILSNSHAITFAAGSSLTGPGALDSRGTSGVTIQIPAAQSGEMRLAPGVSGDYVTAAGSITLGGALGSALQTSAFVLADGGLILDESVAFTGGAAGRIADATPIHLRSGSIRLSGNSSTTSLETAGPIDGSGFSRISAIPGVAGGARLTALSLGRTDRGTFLFRANSLGSAFANGVGNVLFATAPAGLAGAGGTGPNVSILPYAIGDTSSAGGGSGLVTYDAGTGIRLLNPATEYSSNLAAGATHNVRLTASASNPSTVTINSLLLESAVSISGTGSMNVTSGAILRTGSFSSSIANNLAFGSAEANIFVAGTNGSLVISGTLSGSAGLSKSGPFELNLTGANTFTGPLTINAGIISINTMSNLGPDTSALIIHSDGTGSGLKTNLPLTFTRPVEVRSGLFRLVAGSPLTFLGSISGPGGVRIAASSISGQPVNFPGANSYLGPTVIDGQLAFASDSALGNGGPVVLTGTSFANTSILLKGAWNSQRIIEVRGSQAIIDTNGFNAAWSGPVTGLNTGVLFKAGAGTLEIRSQGAYTGALTVQNGSVRMTGAGSLRLNKVTLERVAELVLDNSTQVVTDRIANFAAVLLRGGKLGVIGHATLPVLEALGAASATSGTASRVTLEASAGAPLVLSFASASFADARVLFRGNNLSGGPAGLFSRVVIQTPAPVFGLIPGALVDSTPAGGGNSFATYDSTIDEGGALGLRALRPAEYVTGTVLQNTPSGPTPAGANFLVNGLTTVAGSSNSINSLTLADNANLSLAAGQRLNIGEPGILTQAGAVATIDGGLLVNGSGPIWFQGDGNLTVRGTITGTKGVGFHKLGNGILTFDQARLIGSQNVTVHSGTLRPGAGTGLRLANVLLEEEGVVESNVPLAQIGSVAGTGTLLLSSGVLQVGGGSNNISTFTGSIAGSGGLAISGNYQLEIRGPALHTGPTVVLRDPAVNSGPAGKLIFSGLGSALASSSYGVFGGMTLELNNYSLSATSRLGTSPVTMDGGTLKIGGDQTIPFTQNAGTLILRGFSHVKVQSDSSGGTGGSATTLAFSDFRREQRGTLSVVLGSGSSAAANARLLLGSQPLAMLVGAGTTATNVPILPFAVLGNSSPAQLVTYDAVNGIRPLDFSEYSTSLTSGDNVRIFNETLSSPLTINSLSVTGSLGGSATLTVTSGAVRASGTISTPLEFGTAEAIFFTTSSTLTLSGPISGSNGITFSGVESAALDRFDLQGTNSFTGPFTLNAGTVAFSTAANLGPDSSAMTLKEGTLEYTGALPFTLSRPIQTTAYRAGIRSSGGALTIAGGVSGQGAMQFSGNVILAGANSYGGYTHVGGALTFSSDAVFGSSPLIYLSAESVTNSGILQLAGPWTTSRALTLAGSYTTRIDTAGFDATLTGSLTSEPATTFHKDGLGTLTILDAATLTASVRVNAGTLAVDGTYGSSGGLTVGAGATLKGNGTIMTPVLVQAGATLAPGEGTGVLHTANVSFSLNSALAIELDSPTRYDQLDTTGVVTLLGPVDLQLALRYDPSDFSDSFTIIANDGTDPLNAGSNRFSYGGQALEEGARFEVEGQFFQISYVGGTGNDVVLQAVPEPGTRLLLACGLGLAFLRRKRS